MEAVLDNPPMATKTASFQASLTASAKAVMDRISDESGVPQKEVFSRIMEWFSTLPPPAQKSIIWPDDKADEVDATLVAIDYLQRRRAEAAAADKASKSARNKGSA